MRTTFKSSLIACCSFLLVLLLSCDKDDDGSGVSGNLPQVITSDVTDLTGSSALSGGEVVSDGGSPVTARGLVWGHRKDPDISNEDNTTVEGSGLGSFTSEMIGLQSEATYFVRAYATNQHGTAYGEPVQFRTLCDNSLGTFVDHRDGNVYVMLELGNQIWMGEALRYLPSVSPVDSFSFDHPHYYVYNYNGTNVDSAKATNNYNTYGVLYNWPAAMNGASASYANPSGVQGVCPDGWHLPSEAEWDELVQLYGGLQNAGYKLKEMGTAHWAHPHTAADNESCFTALPAGRTGLGVTYPYFSHRREAAFWWTSSEGTQPDEAVSLGAHREHNMFVGSQVKIRGHKVRCIED